MKQILLMRHAKSGWDNPLLKDFDRPLNERGLKDASSIGKFLRKCDYIPGSLISSPAERAKTTSTLCMKSASLNEEIIIWNRDFYYGGIQDYIAAIQNAEEEHERIMLVGHNPLMEETAGTLAGANSKIAIRMPTAAIVCLESPVKTWKAIHPGACQIKWMIIPENLNEL
ncbi:MAG: histidine phosphatase family protein [Balneolaceae bacterium]